MGCDPFEVLKGAPLGAFPEPGTPEYKLLMMLVSGEEVGEQEMADVVGLSLRLYIQKLRGPSCLFWRLINIKGKRGKIIARQLDPRHLTGNQLDDEKARADRRCEYARQSLKDAECGVKRYSRALSNNMAASENMVAVLNRAKAEVEENAPTEAEA